jgi:crotonobetainyl-CoA:carnitine CoA-transferase CaiB-like acyl-CoA transferase
VSAASEGAIFAPHLSGVRVADVTRILAGPYATMLLGDLGAEVVKVERPGGGDETRLIPPSLQGESHYFASINRNKRGIAVDLKDVKGREIVRRLAACSDVFVENFRPGVANRLGLDAETLLEQNPRLVYCSISAFGQTGPWAERSSFDVAIQALSGAMSVNGESGRAPVRLGLPLGDLSGGLFAVVAILAALVKRERTGRGEVIDVSLLDSMVTLLGYLAGRFFMTGESPQPVGSGHHSIVPYGAYQASDGYLIIATLTESYWPKLCAALDLDQLAAEPGLSTNSGRLAHKGLVNETIAAVIAQRSVAEWCDVLEAADVPHAPVLTLDQVFAHPQVQARELVSEIEHGRLGKLKLAGRAPRFSSLTAHPSEPLPPPLLGQDTVPVLRDLLGYDDGEIRSLLASGVIEAPAL